MNTQSPFSGPTCRGSVSLGTGCRSCEKCLAELSRPRLQVGLQPVQPDGLIALSPPAVEVTYHGLTRRDRFAAAALQGFLADGYAEVSPEKTAKNAVRYADALIAELDREKDA